MKGSGGGPNLLGGAVPNPAGALPLDPAGGPAVPRPLTQDIPALQFPAFLAGDVGLKGSGGGPNLLSLDFLLAGRAMRERV